MDNELYNENSRLFLVKMIKGYLWRYKQKYIYILLLILLFTACTGQDVPWYKVSMEFDKLAKFSEADQTIAFIDTGINPRLLDEYNITHTYNVHDGSENVTDDNGHGTTVISVACGNGYGNVKGLAPNAKIIVIKAADGEGRMSLSNLMNALEYAQKKKVDIVNISLGGNKGSEEVRQKIMSIYQEGITVLASAGDYDQRDLLFPANLSPYIISVAALTEDNKLREESNTGEDLLCAFPGSKIEALDINLQKHTVDGSSEATALATAYIAKIKGSYMQAYNCKISNKDIIHILSSLNSKKDYMEPFDQILKGEI